MTSTLKESLYWVCRPLSSLPPSIYPFFLPFLSFLFFHDSYVFMYWVSTMCWTWYQNFRYLPFHKNNTTRTDTQPFPWSYVLFSYHLISLLFLFAFMCPIYFIALNFPLFVSFGLLFLMSSFILGLRDSLLLFHNGCLRVLWLLPYGWYDHDLHQQLEGFVHLICSMITESTSESWCFCIFRHM